MRMRTMDISSFDDLLRAARAQAEPQRLLFVFVGAGLSEHSTPEQRAGHAAGLGGELAPLMCVDKSPEELAGFSALQSEAGQFGQDWALVFVAALGGRAGRAPDAAQVESALQSMVDAVKLGRVSGYIPFDRSGNPVTLR